MNEMQKKIREMTLVLLYLTSWEEKEFDMKFRRSWKGYDFDILNELSDEGLVSDSRRSKSIILRESGVEQAEALLVKYGITME